jgi:hypothetical protein
MELPYFLKAALKLCLLAPFHSPRNFEEVAFPMPLGFLVLCVVLVHTLQLSGDGDAPTSTWRMSASALKEALEATTSAIRTMKHVNIVIPTLDHFVLTFLPD